MEISLLSCDVSFVNSTKTNDNISESRGFVKEPVLFPSASTIGVSVIDRCVKNFKVV